MDPHQQKSEAKSKKRRPSLDVQKMIAESDVTELRSFLRVESKRNKALALKLKTKLLARYEPSGDHDKYRLLLGELIHEGTDGTITLSKREIRLLNDICAQLLELSRHFHIRNEHRENHRLLNALILYLHRFVDKQAIPPDMLVDRLAEAYTALLSLLQHEIAPELRDDIITGGREAMTRSYHILHHQTLNMPAVLLSATNDEDHLKSITDSLLEKVERGSQRNLWSFWYAIYCAHLSVQIDTEYVHKHLNQKDIYHTAQHLKDNGFTHAFFGWLASFGQLEHLDRIRHNRWLSWQLDRAIEQSSAKDQKEYGYLLLTRTGDHGYWKALLQVTSAGHVINNLIADGHMELAAEFLSIEQRFDDLAELLETAQNWDLFLIHLPEVILYSQDPFKTIWSLVKPFAERFAGAACTQGVEHVLATIEDHGSSALVEQVQEEINTTFPGRFDDLLSRLKISF